MDRWAIEWGGIQMTNYAGRKARAGIILAPSRRGKYQGVWCAYHSKPVRVVISGS